MTIAGQPSYTPATHRVVDRKVADEVIAASREFNLWITLDLAAIAALAAVGVALLAGALHPIGLYFALAVCVTLVTVLSLVAFLEHRKKRPGTEKLDEATSELPYGVAMQIVAPGASSGPTSTSGALPQDQAKVTPASATGPPPPPLPPPLPPDEQGPS